MKFTVQIFARYPRSGQVKTRLAASIGDEAALQLHCDLVERQISQIGRLPGYVACELWCTDAADAPWCVEMLQRNPRLRYRRQVTGTLGVRMDAALRRGMQYSSGVLQIGTDCPVLDTTHIQLCMDELASGTDTVLIAAEDGGYVLAGYSGFYRHLYDGIDWGTDRVLTQTLKRHCRLGLSPVVYCSLWDVDRAEDYDRYRSLGDQAVTSVLQRVEPRYG